MRDELLINVMPGETRAAMLRGGVLSELFIEREGRESLVGNIYLGRVDRIVGGMNAAFVDIGIGRAGFLSADGARESYENSGPAGNPRIADQVREGEAVTVQVVKDAIGSKGVQLARRLSLPGRFLVYTPTQDRISVSRQISDEAEQARLIGLAQRLAEPGEGFILRTAAAGAESADLSRDAGELRAEWESVEALRDQSTAPALLRPELGPVERVLRDNVSSEIAAIRIDSDKGLSAAQSFCERALPRMTARLERYSGPEPIFEAYHVEAEIERALSPRIGLESGGTIVIEATEALTAIDVNSGSLVDASGPDETSRRTNLEAAVEIARQIRLRNIGGLVVIDFIHMEDEANWPEVLETLETGFRRDRNNTRIMGRTAAGLVELTRRRRSESLAQLTTAPCPECAGNGRLSTPRTVAQAVLRALVREASQGPPGKLGVHASVDVIEALKSDAAGALEELAAALGREISMTGAPGYHRDRFEVFVER